MNGLLAGSLSLLWLSAGQVPAEPATPPSGPIVTLGKPVVKLGKPTALDPKAIQAVPVSPVVDRNVQPVTYSPLPGPSTDVLMRRQATAEPLPLPRNAVMENSSPLFSDPAAGLGPMPRVGASQTQPLPAVPMPSVAPAPIYGGGSGAIQGDSAPVGPMGPIYGVPGGAMGQPAIQGGMNYAPPTLVSCDPDDCDACEKGKRRLLPFFEGGCTDYGNPPSRFWVSAEYLLWQVKNQHTPAGDYQPPDSAIGAGVLPSDHDFPGQDGPSSMAFAQARLTFGMWFFEDQCLGIESSSFFLGSEHEQRLFIGRLADPGAAFTNVPTSLLAPFPGQLSVVAFPGVVAGTVSVRTSSELYGTELNLRSNLCARLLLAARCTGRLPLCRLNESLDITENLVEAANGFNPGGPVIVRTAQTTNNFYGGQFGLDMGFKRGRWSLDLLGKIAIGDMHEPSHQGSRPFPAWDPRLRAASWPCPATSAPSIATAWPSFPKAASRSASRPRSTAACSSGTASCI